MTESLLTIHVRDYMEDVSMFRDSEKWYPRAVVKMQAQSEQINSSFGGIRHVFASYTGVIGRHLVAIQQITDTDDPVQSPQLLTVLCVSKARSLYYISVHLERT